MLHHHKTLPFRENGTSDDAGGYDHDSVVQPTSGDNCRSTSRSEEATWARTNKTRQDKKGEETKSNSHNNKKLKKKHHNNDNQLWS